MAIIVHRSNGRDQVIHQRIQRDGRRILINMDTHIHMIRMRERMALHTQCKDEPKGNWKKSDYSKPSRDWKKNDGKYSSKDEPKGHQDYKPKHDNKDYSSKDEPNH